jgi:hypothetical protein
MWLLALLLPGALLGFGMTGLVRTARRWGRSEEAIAASTGLVDLLDPSRRPPAGAGVMPGVPACDDLVNSPGTVLRYRLPIESADTWTLFGLGLFAVLWNAVLAVLAVGAGLDLAGGRIDWLLIALLIPFAAIGCTGIVLFVRQLFLAAAVGTTQIEISDHPLRPGGRYDVLLAQSGAGTMHDLGLSLELEEQATFHQGTDTRPESLVVVQRPVRAWDLLQLDPTSRFEERMTVEIPVDTMHSFVTEHNAVRWRFVVRGKPSRWPGFVRVFPIIVHPRDTARQTSHAEPAPIGTVAGRACRSIVPDRRCRSTRSSTAWTGSTRPAHRSRHATGSRGSARSRSGPSNGRSTGTPRGRGRRTWAFTSSSASRRRLRRTPSSRAR